MPVAMLATILVFSIGSAFASPISSDGDSDSMLQPVPASLKEFVLTADGTSVTKREGRDGPFVDADVHLQGSITAEDDEYSRFEASGNVVLGDGRKFNISEAEGTIIFFKDARGNSIAGLMNMISKQTVDDSGNDAGRFRLRAFIMDDSSDNTWQISVSPSGKIGKSILLVGMDGTISGGR